MCFCICAQHQGNHDYKIAPSWFYHYYKGDSNPARYILHIINKHVHLLDSEYENWHLTLLKSKNYTISNDTIYLNKKYSIKILDSLRFMSISLKGIPFHTIFYCTMRFYEDGFIKFRGQWKDGYPDGQWLFFDKNRKATIITYKTGVIVEKRDATEEEKYPWNEFRINLPP